MPRKPMTKEAKIKRALEAGVPVNEISRRYNTSYQYVNVIKRKMYKQRQAQQPVQEHSVGPLPEAPRAEPMFATGIVALHPEPVPPTAGLASIPLGVGEIRELKVAEKPTLWQRFKLWAWGRA